MPRTVYSPEFKAKIVIEVLEGARDLEAIAADNQLNPNMVRKWKSEFLQNAGKAFEQCIHIIESCDLDECGDNVTVRMENGYELSPHVYEEVERIENATVVISRCTECGKYDIGWFRQ